jgi:ribosomal-protein-alanine N-acetyltransferase
MSKVELRYQKVSDAKRMYDILNNRNFLYLDVKPESVESERDWLRENPRKRKDNLEYNYAILWDGKVVGACGIKIDQHRKHIGEIGYFLDETCWGKGITTRAVKLLERIGFGDLKLTRIEILMDPANTASERVAIKCGYGKEGTMKKAIKRKGTFHDCYLYAKVR